MKRMLMLCLIAGMVLLHPVSADLFTDMNERVAAYNAHATEVPDPIKMLLGNDEIYGIISQNDGSTLLVRMVTRDAVIEEFSKVAENIQVETVNFTAAEALEALRMAVGKTPEDEKFDVDRNGKVTTVDARIILQYAVGLSAEKNPTLVVRTDEDTLRGIMESDGPARAFITAYDGGTLSIEGVGVVKVITLAVGNAFFTIARMIGIVQI
jgi:hypothetical protein